MHPTAVVPIKGFTSAKERLYLPQEARAALVRATAAHVVETCRLSGLPVVVVTPDEAVAEMARGLGADIVADPGGGLDAAAAAGTAGVDSWLVLHGDLPILDETALSDAGEALTAGLAPIGPARDGGTNLIGGQGPFHFSYGPASFHRHLAAIAHTGRRPAVLVSEAIATEIDTVRDLGDAAARPAGAWLEPFLT